VPVHGVDLIVLTGVSGRTLASVPLRTGRRGDRRAGYRDRDGASRHALPLSPARAPGDEIVVELPGRSPARFRVEELAVVDARSATIRADPRSPALVLMTCYPFDALVPGGPLRYVVTARARRRGEVRAVHAATVS